MKFSFKIPDGGFQLGSQSLFEKINWSLKTKGMVVGGIALLCTILFSGFIYYTVADLKDRSAEYKKLSKEHEVLSSMSSSSLQSGQAIRNLYVNGSDEVAFANLKLSTLEIAKSANLLAKEYPADLARMNLQLRNYVANIESIIKGYEETGSVNKSLVENNTQIWRTLKGPLNARIKEVDGVRNDVGGKLSEQLEHMHRTIFGFGIVTTVIMFMALFVFYMGVVVSVQKVKDGLLGFFEFLHRRQKTISPISIKSDDEFAQMANMINENIFAIQDGLKKDAILISEVSEVVMKVKNGFYSYKVNSSADNQMLEELKNKFNEMIESTNTNIHKLIGSLSHYGNSDFTYHIDTKDISGNFGSLVEEVNELGMSVSELIAIIIASGKKLEANTKKLSISAENLSSSSSEQAASLEETASAIEEITSTIRNTAEQADIMAHLAVDASRSAKEGNMLAKATKEAMEDIAKATDAINEAVTIVDKIAFQTNILSLNATVEAARAGDAGRGFAVVASEVRNLASRSSDAVKKITELVEVAKTKANEGRQIATTMKESFENLNQKTARTTEIVEFVAVANKEQMAGIEQINDSLIHLDRMTQETSKIASDTNTMSKEVSALSEYLMRTASRTRFKEEAKQHIQNVDLVFDLANIKQEIIMFKEFYFQELAQKGKVAVMSPEECNVGRWIESHKSEGFARTKSFEEFMDLHDESHKLLQDFIDESTKQNSSYERVKELGFLIELNTNKMLRAVDGVKRELAQ